MFPLLSVINEDIKKNCDKVVDVVDVEDMASDKVAYCRCWKSAKVIKLQNCMGTQVFSYYRNNVYILINTLSLYIVYTIIEISLKSTK